MDISKGYEDAIIDTCSLLQQKGYRANFTFVAEDGDRQPLRDSLKGCLEKAVRVYLSSYKHVSQFSLYTFAHYKSDDNNIHCKFRITLDDREGFSIRGLEITDARTHTTHRFRFENNWYLQPATQLKGYFQRRRSWEIWLSKFKP